MSAKGCSLCDEDDEVIIADKFVEGGPKTCRDSDEEARGSWSENGDNFLSLCPQYRERYKEQCCVKLPTASDASTIMQTGAGQQVAENEFGVSQKDNMFGKSKEEPEKEFSGGFEFFGVRREDPWSDAAKSWPIGCYVLLFTMLAFLPAHFLWEE